MSEVEALLIAAPSGRALASAARAAGYLPLVADFFDDLDTRERAAKTRLVEGDFVRGFEEAPLMAALEALASGQKPLGFIYGAGFEDRVDLLEAIAKHWPLLGNKPEVVAHVKDPSRLATLCAGLGIPHPDISFEAPEDRSEWLVKQAGGSGGMHIASAAISALSSQDYYQRRVMGTPISCLILGDGTKAFVLGLSMQWVTPAPEQPWRYGGAARPAPLDAKLAQELETASMKIAEAAHLTGLNSMDFLADGSEFHLIEVNPRPGATLDIFHERDGRLLQAHIDACKGQLPEKALRFEPAEAAAFVYAPFAIPSMPVFTWPEWTADRQKPASAVAQHDPLCTVMACGADLISTRALLEERAARILTLLSKSSAQREAAA